MRYLNQSQFSKIICNKITLSGFFIFLSILCFAQIDSINVLGNLIGLNGNPIGNKKIYLKDNEIETTTNEIGEFTVNVPKSLSKYTFTLETDNFTKIEFVFKEKELNEPIFIRLKYKIQESGTETYETELKPSFKQRVINTITWPYRKIKDTFFKNE